MTRTEYLTRTIRMALDLSRHLNLSSGPDIRSPWVALGDVRWSSSQGPHGDAHNLGKEAFGLLCKSLSLDPAKTPDRWERYTDDCRAMGLSLCPLTWLREDAS